MVAAIASLIFYLVYILALDTNGVRCAWCGIHFPKAGVEFPYFAQALLFVLIGVLARKGKTWGRFRPRPAAVWWCAFEAVAYGLAAVGLTVLHYAGRDSGFRASATVLDGVRTQEPEEDRAAEQAYRVRPFAHGGHRHGGHGAVAGLRARAAAVQEVRLHAAAD